MFCLEGEKAELAVPKNTGGARSDRQENTSEARANIKFSLIKSRKE